MRPEHGTILTGTAPNYKQTVTVSAKSTNEVKLGANAGAGELLRFRGTVITSFHEADSGSNGTVTVALQHSTASGSGHANLVVSRAFGTAELVAGFEFDLLLPAVHNAYIQGYFTASETYDAGEVSLALMKDVDSNRSH